MSVSPRLRVRERMNKMWLWNTNAHGDNIVHIGYVKYRGHSQGHKVIYPGVIWKGFISWVSMPHMKFLYLTVQKSWLRLKVFLWNIHTHTDRHTDRKKLDALKLHSGGMKRRGFSLGRGSPCILWHIATQKKTST